MPGIKSQKTLYEPPLSQCPEPIAIVGMGCRLPGSIRSPSQLWELLIHQRSTQTDLVPETRFNILPYLNEAPERPGSLNVPGGYFLDEDIRNFDPSFFGISPIEATWMDPQQRKLLEVAYECFESAGLTLSTLSGSNTGCYIASFTSDYQQLSVREPDFRHSYAATGVDPGILASRLGHIFNLNGPSLLVNTACSSSVYALHQACGALRNNEIEAALVGGTNLILTVDQHLNTAKLGVLSPTSTCHTFDASADGYGRAEAVGALYLKKLSDAMRDGNPIRAVIRGSAINTNGKVQGTGITFPNVKGQERVIKEAYRLAGGLNVLLCGFFECHGTGTPIGDPVEVTAVSRAMTADRSIDDPLLIGAVKPNIGHSEAASGISAVIKAVLMVEKGLIPPVKGFESPNPEIPFSRLKVKVANKVMHWPNLPIRRVSVNSFGYGGTNAHVIVDSIESVISNHSFRIPRLLTATDDKVKYNRCTLLPFSAHDQPTFYRNISALRKYLTESPLQANDLAYTLCHHRNLFGFRGYTICNDEKITTNTLEETSITAGSTKEIPHRIAFVFTGQGAQWPQMGSELIEHIPEYRNRIQSLDAILKGVDPTRRWTITDSLLEPSATSRVHQVDLSQTLCTAIQIALVDLLAGWGVVPLATVGHSSGEIAAAYTAGYITAEEAIITAYFRGKVLGGQEPVQPGAMLAVGRGVTEVRPFLVGFEDQVVVACQNSPHSVTLSGDRDAIEQLAAIFDRPENGVFNRQLRTGGRAYHSHHMRHYSEAYKDSLKAYSPPRGCVGVGNSLFGEARQMISSVYGKAIQISQITPAYWVENLTGSVLFDTAVEALLEDRNLDITKVIEIGPHSALAGPLRQIIAQEYISKSGTIQYLPTLIRSENSLIELLKLAGTLFLENYPVDIGTVNTCQDTDSTIASSSSFLTDLPPYEWNYSSLLWGESRLSSESRSIKYGRHDLLGSRLLGGTPTEPTWRNILRLKDIPWLAHHHLGQENIFPAAGYWTIALEAITQLIEQSTDRDVVDISSFTVRDTVIKSALVIPEEDDGVEVLTVGQFDGKWLHFKVSSTTGGTWHNHAEGRITVNLVRYRNANKEPSAVLSQISTGKRWYRGFQEVGFKYNGIFQGIRDVKTNFRVPEALATTEIRRTAGLKGESRYVLHPATIDSCLHAVLIAIPYGQIRNLDVGYVPVQAEEMQINLSEIAAIESEESLGSTFAWVYRKGARSRMAALQLRSTAGKILLEISGLKLVQFDGALVLSSEHSDFNEANGVALWEPVWKPDIWGMNEAQAAQYFPQVREKAITALLDLYLFKEPELSLLIVAENHQESPFKRFVERKYPQCSFQLRSTDEGNQLRLTENSISQVFDLIVLTDPVVSVHVEDIRNRLSPRGVIILTDAEQLATSLEREFTTCFNLPSGVIVMQKYLHTTPALEYNPSDSGIEDITAHAVLVLYPGTDKPKLLDIMEHCSSSSNIEVTSLPLSEFQYKEKSSIRATILLDIEKPVLEEIEKLGYMGDIKQMLSMKSVIWVTNGGLMDNKRPEFGMTTGFARSVRSEDASLDLMTVDIDLDGESVDIDEIARIILSQVARTSQKSQDNQLYIKDGLVFINRLQPYKEPDKTVTSRRAFETPIIARKGLHTNLVNEKPLEGLEPRRGEILIEVKAVGVNPELFTNPDSTILCHEIAGRVIEVGEGVSSVAIGDTVVALTLKGGARYERLPIDFVYNAGQVVAKNLDYEDMVLSPLAYTTAVHIFEMARISKGERMLIFSGTGHVGFALLTLAMESDVLAYAVVESSEEAAALQLTLDIPEPQVVLRDELLSMLGSDTEENRFDIIVGAVNEKDKEEAWRMVANFGTLVELHTDTNTGDASLDIFPLRRHARYLTVDVIASLAHKPKLISRSFQTAMEYLMKNRFRKPAISCSHASLEDLPEFVVRKPSFVDQKVAVSYREKFMEPRTPPTAGTALFKPDACYLLVGCLGGLGRSLSRWMIENGAQHLVFMGRSGADKAEAAALIRSLQENGIAVSVFRGDVSNAGDVEQVRDDLQKSCYPLRGIIQAAMVLEDCFFETMTAEGFMKAAKPKVQGARNIHEVFKFTDLDFLVMTSSISATVGTPGQANYSAGNSYLDSLARQRRQLGLPAVSLILPMVLGIGYVAENPEIEELLNRKGLYGIEEAELLDAFRMAVMDTAPSELIIGMDVKHLAKALRNAQTADTFWYGDRRFSHVSTRVKRVHQASDINDLSNQDRLLIRLSKAAEPAEAMAEYIMEKLARLLLINQAEMEASRSISFYGLDSMIGSELRNWIFREFSVDVSLAHILANENSIQSLAEELWERIQQEATELLEEAAHEEQL